MTYWIWRWMIDVSRWHMYWLITDVSRWHMYWLITDVPTNNPTFATDVSTWLIVIDVSNIWLLHWRYYQHDTLPLTYQTWRWTITYWIWRWMMTYRIWRWIFCFCKNVSENVFENVFVFAFLILQIDRSLDLQIYIFSDSMSISTTSLQ